MTHSRLASAIALAVLTAILVPGTARPCRAADGGEPRPVAVDGAHHSWRLHGRLSCLLFSELKCAYVRIGDQRFDQGFLDVTLPSQPAVLYLPRGTVSLTWAGGNVFTFTGPGLVRLSPDGAYRLITTGIKGTSRHPEHAPRPAPAGVMPVIFGSEGTEYAAWFSIRGTVLLQVRSGRVRLLWAGLDGQDVLLEAGESVRVRADELAARRSEKLAEGDALQVIQGIENELTDSGGTRSAAQATDLAALLEQIDALERKSPDSVGREAQVLDAFAVLLPCLTAEDMRAAVSRFVEVVPSSPITPRAVLMAWQIDQGAFFRDLLLERFADTAWAAALRAEIASEAAARTTSGGTSVVPAGDPPEVGQ